MKEDWSQIEGGSVADDQNAHGNKDPDGVFHEECIVDASVVRLFFASFFFQKLHG